VIHRFTRIPQATPPGGGTLLVTVGPGSSAFTDANLARKTRYYYRVAAMNSIGEGPRSTEVSAVAR